MGWGTGNIGGGSGGLNFKVVAYGSEKDLLAATPKENTIGIITSVDITRWIFSANDPINFKIASDAGETVGTAGDSTYYKKNSGKAIFAFSRNETKVIPVLLSDSSDAAILMNSEGNEYTPSAFTYKGKTWYNTYPGKKISLWDTAKPKITHTTKKKDVQEYLADMFETAEGMVWISTGTSSAGEFNALKKNGLQVYPIAAKQYVSGEWVDRTAKIYQGGAWVGWWNGEIYDIGNMYEDITGGWSVTEGNATVENTADGLVFTGTNNYQSSISTNKKINITGYKTFTFQVVANTYAASDAVGLSTTKTPGGYTGDYVAVLKGYGNPLGTTLDLSIDLTGVPEGEYYIICFVANQRQRVFKKMKLE